MQLWNFHICEEGIIRCHVSPQPQLDVKFGYQTFSHKQFETAHIHCFYLLSIPMESLLVNLKKQVTCSICLDTYTEPKTISCLHTFCCECLEKHARVSQKQGKFRCPECQAAIDLPEGNRFDRLPNSFFHKSLLSLLAVR